MEKPEKENQDQQPQKPQPDQKQAAEQAVDKPVTSSAKLRRQPREDGRRKKSVSGKPGRSESGTEGSTKPEEIKPEMVEKVLSIKRVTKVTKGGKKLSFSALVVVGDTCGKVGYGLDKAGEVATAIKKSLSMAKKNMIAVPLKGTTIPHEIIGVNGGAQVLLKPACEGTGVIAAGPVRAVCDGAGIHNILTKCHRSNNPINVVKATINGLTQLKPYRRETAP